VVELQFSEMEKKFAAMEEWMVALKNENLMLSHWLSVFNQLQEEYWVNQTAMEERADNIYTHQSEYEEKTMVELESLNKKVTWSNKMIHEDRLNIRLQGKRIDCLVTFEDQAVTQLKDAPTWAWCKNKVESWKDWLRELGSHVNLLSSCIWDAEQQLMIHNHCHHCLVDYNSAEVSGWCHDFHLYTHFLLSSKRPNIRSNHDMALSYLIISFHTSKSHDQDEESR